MAGIFYERNLSPIKFPLYNSLSTILKVYFRRILSFREIYDNKLILHHFHQLFPDTWKRLIIGDIGTDTDILLLNKSFFVCMDAFERDNSQSMRTCIFYRLFGHIFFHEARYDEQIAITIVNYRVGPKGKDARKGNGRCIFTLLQSSDSAWRRRQ